jgi:sugar phosphate isomerase/epimerase
MKLSIASESIAPYIKSTADHRMAYTAIRECGFTCVDFGVGTGKLEGDVDAVATYWRQLFEDCGIAFTQAHGPGLNPLKPTATGVSPAEYMHRALRFCQVAGCPRMVIHPGAIEKNTRAEFFEKNIAFFQSLLPYAEETGVEIMIENIGHYMDPYFLWSGADLREMIDAVDHPLVTACWDIGHANHFEYMHAGGSPYDSIVALGDKLKAIHAHDNIGFFPDPNKSKRLDMHTVPYASLRTSVNWDAVMQGLKDVNYQGTFNFETITPAPATRRPEFVYNGEVVRTLECAPIGVWKAMNKALYEIGRFMLESYGMYEE